MPIKYFHICDRSQHYWKLRALNEINFIVKVGNCNGNCISTNRTFLLTVLPICRNVLVPFETLKRIAMKVLTAALILSTLFVSYTHSASFNYPLIKDYLQWNNIKVAVFVKCGLFDWLELENIENNLNINDIYLGHWDMSGDVNLSNFNYRQFFVRSTYPFCVVVDAECNITDSFLNELSVRMMFHYERHWLMFGRSSEEMFATLSEEQINVDAEVVVAAAISEK